MYDAWTDAETYLGAHGRAHGQAHGIADGVADRAAVTSSALRTFEAKFRYFVEHIDRMDVLFASSFLFAFSSLSAAIAARPRGGQRHAKRGEPKETKICRHRDGSAE